MSSEADHAFKSPNFNGRTRRDGDIIARVNDGRLELSRSQRRIADAALQHPALFAERSIQELCDWIEVSAPTITRFCRRVGCDGLRDFKLQLMGAAQIGRHYLDPQSPPDTLDSIREQVASRAHDAILQAVRIPDVDIEKAIDAILRAGTLYAFGSGGVSSWLVAEVQNRFFRLGVRVVPCNDGIMQKMLSATLDREDVVLCCSLGGVNVDLVAASGIAAGYGATTIGLAPGGTALARSVDILLSTWIHDDGDVLCPTAMRYACLAIIDMLAYGAAIRARPQAMEKLRRVKRNFIEHVDGHLIRPLSD